MGYREPSVAVGVSDCSQHGFRVLTAPKRPRDTNQLAKMVVDIATEQPDDANFADDKSAIASLGRMGGLKGGKARAEALTSEQRAFIARQAAAARWQKKNGSN